MCALFLYSFNKISQLSHIRLVAFKSGHATFDVYTRGFMFDVGQVIRGKVEKLVFGGKGLIRHEGWVIFVPDVVAHEVVDVTITAKKKSYFEGQLSSVIEASPLRTIAPCPYFGHCGGCQLQHMVYSEQLKVKKEWLIDALARTAGISINFPVEVTAAKKEWAYRQKVILHGPECGFYARDNTTIIPIERCLIFSDKDFDDVRTAVQQETNPIKITVMKDEDNNRTIIVDDKVLKSKNVFEYSVDDLRIFYSPKVFVQNDPHQALQIYKDVLENVQDGPILDLYCGHGVMTLMAAKRGHKVLGIELSFEAIACAKKSAKANGLDAEFQAKPCEKIKNEDAKKYDQWIVNPPRTGLSEKMMEIIFSHKPKRLVYISCMPSTLARDCKGLYKEGYVIEKAQVYDMFAETTHLETVVYFNLTNF